MAVLVPSRFYWGIDELPTYTYTGSSSRVDSKHPTKGTDRYYVILKSSGNFSMSGNSSVGVFVVGGGNSGNAGTNSSSATSPGGGGGAGKTLSSTLNLIGGTSYSCIIGAGGIAPASANRMGSPGGSTSFNNISVSGGTVSGTVYGKGTDGGSGGGGRTGTSGGSGGSNGANGTGNVSYGLGGSGQGTTTRPFGGDVSPFSNTTSMLYAAGGSGGSTTNGSLTSGAQYGGGAGCFTSAGKPGTANTGSGGGGGTYGTLNYGPGNGGSGVIIVRVGDWSA